MGWIPPEFHSSLSSPSGGGRMDHSGSDRCHFPQWHKMLFLPDWDTEPAWGTLGHSSIPRKEWEQRGSPGLCAVTSTALAADDAGDQCWTPLPLSSIDYKMPCPPIVAVVREELTQDTHKAEGFVIRSFMFVVQSRLLCKEVDTKYFIFWNHPPDVLPGRSGVSLWGRMCWQCQPKANSQVFLWTQSSARSSLILHHMPSPFRNSQYTSLCNCTVKISILWFHNLNSKHFQSCWWCFPFSCVHPGLLLINVLFP